MATRAGEQRRLMGAFTRGPVVAAAVTLAFACGVASGFYSAARHSSPARDTGDLDAVRDRLVGSALRPIDPSQLDQAAERAMIAALNDPWAAFASDSDEAPFVAGLAGRYSGVGVWLLARPDHTVYVAQVQPGSPAATAHIAVGATVTSIDGRSTAGMSPGDAAAVLRGAPGTSVVLGLRAGGAPDRLVTLVREELQDDAVKVDRLSPQVGRITITEFVNGVGGRVHEALQALRTHHVRGVVIDVRGNPGGVLEEAVRASSAFLPTGAPVVSYVGRDGAPRMLRADPGGDTTIPVAVLVDGGTASAAEVLAAALQDNGRAVVIGTTTFGKGTVQQPMQFADGTGAEITVARYLTPDGRSLDGVGLTPDIEVPPGSGPRVSERRAMELLDGLLADAGTGGRG